LGGTAEYANVPIRHKSHLIGDTKCTLAARAGMSQIKNVVTGPVTHSRSLSAVTQS